MAGTEEADVEVKEEEEEPGRGGSRHLAKSLGVTGGTTAKGTPSGAREYSFRSAAEEPREGLLQTSSQEAEEDALLVRVEAASDPRSDSSLALGVTPLLPPPSSGG